MKKTRCKKAETEKTWLNSLLNKLLHWIHVSLPFPSPLCTHPRDKAPFPTGYLERVLATDKAGNVTPGFSLLRGSAFAD